MSTISRGNPKNLANVRSRVYNHYVKVDNPRSLIFVSGQLSRDEHGNMVGRGDMAEQTRQAVRNIETVLAEAGATLADVVQVTVYTTDMRMFTELNAARTEFFKEPLPTSTAVEVSHLSEPGLMVEIQAVAAL